MTDYKSLGLVNTKEMFAKAVHGGYAIPAFNFNNMEQLQAIIKAAADTKSPVILQVSKGARNYANPILLRYMAQGAVEYARSLGWEHPQIVLHLDHGDTFELCKSAIDDGFTSVMIDASHHSFEENIKLTSQVVKYAHDKGVVVEAELGRLAGVEDNVKVSESDALYTDPEEAAEFVAKTGVDSLAIAIGTSHGAFKFKGEAKLRFDILEKVSQLLPKFPIVLHGASSVLPDYVKMVNDFGGAMPGAKGIPEEMLRKAASMAVCKINVDSDLRLAFTAAVRKHFAENPAHFDPRQYLGDGRALVTECVRQKLVNVLGCAGKA